jgi:hypothetical protein
MCCPHKLLKTLSTLASFIKTGTDLNSYTAANPGADHTSDAGDPPWFHTEVADYHTHGADDENGLSELFSPADIQGNDEQHILGYLGTPRLAIKKYDPCSGKVTTLQIGVTP